MSSNDDTNTEQERQEHFAIPVQTTVILNLSDEEVILALMTRGESLRHDLMLALTAELVIAQGKPINRQAA